MLLDVEIGLQRFFQLQERLVRIAAHEPVGGQDCDVVVVDIGAVGHDVVEGFVAAPLAALAAHVIAVAERRFVTMVAVGDQ